MNNAMKKKLFLVTLLNETSEQPKRKKIWTREIFQRREELGAYHRLVNEMRLADREYFFR